MVEELLAEACDGCGTPGAVLAVDRGGVLEVFTAGRASVKDEERLTPAHQFPPMSLAKSMTAVLVIELCRAGRLSLTAPLAEVLPELSAADWSHEVTVDHLLGCDGGIPAYGFTDTGEGEDAVALYPAKAASLEPLLPPGTRFSYSNAAFALAAAVVEIVTGARFDDLLAQYIFEPLEMTGTGSWYRKEPTFPVTQHFVGPDGSATPLGWWKLRSGAGAGTGTLFATAGDVARYGRAHITEWAELRDHRAAFPGPHAEGWGRGWALYGWGASVFGWDGFGPGAKTFLRVLPEHDAAVALFTNGSNGREVYRGVVPLLLREQFGVVAAPETWPVVTRDAPDVRAAGRFRNGDAAVTIDRRGDDLTLTDSLGRSFPMRSAGDGRFVTPEQFEYPTVELDGDLLTYFCSVWRRDESPPL